MMTALAAVRPALPRRNPPPFHHPRFALLGLLLPLLLAACGAAPVPPPPADPAAALAPMPLLVAPADFRQSSGAVLQGRMHVLGGHEFFNGQRQHWVFTPADASWQQAAPMPDGCYAMGVATDGDRLYATGGLNGPIERSRVMFDFGCAMRLMVYDAAAGRWLDNVPLPAARFNHAAVRVGEELFLLGGQTITLGGGEVDAEDPFSIQVTNTRQAWAYHLRTGAWRAVADLPRVRVGPVALERDGRIWLIGGRDFNALTAVDVYDPATDTWSAGPDLPIAAAQAAGAVLPGGAGPERLLVVGGHTGGLLPQDLPLMWSEAGDGVWRPAGALATARSGHLAVGAGGALHVVGGYGRDAPRTVERFCLP